MLGIWRRERVWLLVGDVATLFLGLWLALGLRAAGWPTATVLLDNLLPFSIVFAFWLVVFYVSDFYRRSVFVFAKRMIGALVSAAAVSSFLSVVFFYLFFPAFGITPKTVLLLDLVITWLLLGGWRLWLAPRVVPSQPLRLAFWCRGEAVARLTREFASNPRYGFIVTTAPDLSSARAQGVSLIVVDAYGEADSRPVAGIYQAMFAGLGVVHLEHLYEEVFNCLPLQSINERWFLENFSNQPRPWYVFGKRLTDLLLAISLGLLSLLFYPLIALAITLDDGRPFFFTQERVGRAGRVFQIYKFRSMRDGLVTRVGRVLRRTRLDELPQLWNVLRGELAIIGPRPERPDYAAAYRRDIPFYDARHLIEPGLSGWAQIYHANHPHHSISNRDTADKLSYDLYYIKNRGFTLDLVIILKTIQIMLARRGI